MELNEMIPGEWYKYTALPTKYYFKFIRPYGKGMIVDCLDVYSPDKIILQKDDHIGATDFYLSCVKADINEFAHLLPPDYEFDHSKTYNIWN